MNCTTKLVRGVNSFTHESYSKTVALHKVECSIEGELLIGAKDVEKEDEVVFLVQKYEETALKTMRIRADQKLKKTFDMLLTELGFTTI